MGETVLKLLDLILLFEIILLYLSIFFTWEEIVSGANDDER
jgi:hypothetical protein